MTWIQQSKNLLHSLVNDSFPELAREKILLSSFNLGPFWGAAWWILPGFRVIVLSPKSRAIPQSALIALLVHELSHHLVYKREGWLKYVTRTPLIYMFFRFRIRDEEHRANRLVMRRGYGRNLYDLTEIIDQDPRHGCVQKYYSTKDEIKNYCLERGLKF
ncbi:MAG: hypothetical protein NTX66_00675 [Candidatus Falkowbacteria bacterium]|nr:hypothetical protein [Candidatus Falkowbacteria bacterium]